MNRKILSAILALTFMTPMPIYASEFFEKKVYEFSLNKDRMEEFRTLKPARAAYYTTMCSYIKALQLFFLGYSSLNRPYVSGIQKVYDKLQLDKWEWNQDDFERMLQDKARSPSGLLNNDFFPVLKKIYEEKLSEYMMKEYELDLPYIHHLNSLYSWKKQRKIILSGLLPNERVLLNPWFKFLNYKLCIQDDEHFKFLVFSMFDPSSNFGKLPRDLQTLLLRHYCMLVIVEPARPLFGGF